MGLGFRQANCGAGGPLASLHRKTSENLSVAQEVPSKDACRLETNSVLARSILTGAPMRTPVKFLIPALVAAMLSGCGGYVGPKTATITGTVLDVDNNAVIGARVWTVDASTVSSTSGAYQISFNRHGEVKVRGEIVKNGVTYTGVNYALNFDNEQTQNVNIVVGPASSKAKIVGTVRDRDGFLLENVAVYAYNGAGSSSRTFTNTLGNYVLEDLLSNVSYTVSASARTYRNDTDGVVLAAGETRNLNLILGNPASTEFNAPANLEVVTWVSPTDPTRSTTTGDDAYTKFKKLYEPRYNTSATLQTRALRGDLIVESDLFWDEITHADLLGFNIYRGNGVTVNLSFLDYLAEPHTAYFVDIGPNVATTYSYGVTALATLYPEYPTSESDVSNIVNAETLDRLDLLSVNFDPLTFRWWAGSGAEQYFVFLYDEFPGVAANWIWDNLASPVAGTSLTYAGPSLEAGRTYYYLVLGTANGGSSRTISQVGSFQA